MGQNTKLDEDGYIKPTEELLDGVGPGCFVKKVDSNGLAYWVEITAVGVKGYKCIARPSLMQGSDQGVVSEGDLVIVTRDQISALGCDKFCFC